MTCTGGVSRRFGRVSGAGAWLVLALAGLTWADEPLPPPEPKTVCSPSRMVCATSRPNEGTFVHKPGEVDADAALWSLPGWQRVFFVSNEGILVTGYQGVNLVPRQQPASTVVLEFWREGRRFKFYTLAELGYPRERLRRTASHYHWGGYLGFGADGKFRLEMVDDVVLVFDPSNGTLVRRVNGDD